MKNTELIYTFHVIEYQYRGLPHAHLVVRLDDANDIDDPNREDLIYFVNRHFVAEMPCFEGEEYHNVYHEDGSTAFTDEYKRNSQVLHSHKWVQERW